MANTDKENPKTTQLNLNEMSYRELSKLYDKNLKAELQLEAKLTKAQKEAKNLEDKLDVAGDNLVKIAKAMESAKQREKAQKNQKQSIGSINPTNTENPKKP
ncbi:hypothetical protein NHP21005_19700 (plasmid) [Helicobacter sp. NHP21005]|uniref:hypothetical protein n=1 Tax=Helicobacter felistomachi TaxID=3040201 RepID=UPI002572C188|nr:hypothetical protein [Helicobacter sp. NHP21005]BEG58282.1 hypothetical protein NHP21005_19700 [Helicobacter sp. NHP21005]